MKDFVAKQQIFYFGAEITQGLHDRARFIDEAGGKIVFESANAVEVGVETSTRCCFDQVQNMFTIAERHEHRSDGA